MIQIENFIEEFGRGVNILLEHRINRDDIRVLVSPFVFRKLHQAFQNHIQEQLSYPGKIYHLATMRAKGEELQVLGVLFGPTDGWPNFDIVLSFRDADILATSVKPITLKSNKWL